MLKFTIISFILGPVGWAMQLPPEPRLPTRVCFQLGAEITEGPVGYIPESAESKPDTQRIQEALNNCSSGEAVKLVKGEGDAFLSGPLEIPSGVTLWIDAGVTLFASRNPRDFDMETMSCGVLQRSKKGCKSFITILRGKKNAIVGDGTIDGRGGQKMMGSNETWWELAWRAKQTGHQSCPRLIMINRCEDFVLYRVRLHNSPSFHVVTKEMLGFIAWGVKVDTPSVAYPEGTRARNTDAFDPNGQNMVFTQCYINAGDDNIAVKAGSFQVSNMLIQDNHFYRGHGMSIGSETSDGVVNITVRNLSIDGGDNGLRIKSDSSKGGNVSGIRYENICIRNTDSPLVFDSFYSDNKGSKYPTFHDIHVKNTRIVDSKMKAFVFRGYDENHLLKISLDNVFNDVAIGNVTATNVEFSLGPGQVYGIDLKADKDKNVKILDKSKASTPFDCSNMFVPFPR